MYKISQWLSTTSHHLQESFTREKFQEVMFKVPQSCTKDHQLCTKDHQSCTKDYQSCIKDHQVKSFLVPTGVLSNILQELRFPHLATLKCRLDMSAQPKDSSTMIKEESRRSMLLQGTLLLEFLNHLLELSDQPDNTSFQRDTCLHNLKCKCEAHQTNSNYLLN